MKRRLIVTLSVCLLLAPGTRAWGEGLTDIAGHPYEREIRELYQRTVIAGYPDGTFRPDRPVTRAEYVVLLDRAYFFPNTAGPAEFSDVPNWAAPAAERARAAKVTAGVGHRRFDPHSPVTREQAITMLVRVLTGERNLETDGSGMGRFEDGDRVSPSFRAPVEWAAANGLLGEGGRLRPATPLTRGELARLLTIAEERFPLITVVGLNETHGGVEPVVDRQTNREKGGAAAFAGYIADRRTKNPDGIVLIDTGDSMQETMISNMSRGKVVVEVFNALGLDATAVGNHEWDWGEDVLRERVAESSYPYLAVNVVQKVSGMPPDFIRQTAKVERRGLTIGLVAATLPETPTITMPAHVEAYDFLAATPTMERYVQQLRPQVDILIGFGHLGIEPNGRSGAMIDLAETVAGVDAWFAGHIPVELVVEAGGVPVVQGGKAMSGAAEVSMIFDTRTRTIRNRWASVRRIWTNEWDPDAAIAAIVARYREQVDEMSREVLAMSAVELKRDRYAESNVGNWVADVMRTRTGTQVAFTNGGGIRTDVPAGDVTYGQLYVMLPFDNHLVTMNLTGAQLKETLENGVSLKHSLIQVSGLSFRWDSTQPVGQRVTDVLVGGLPLDPAATYSVTTQNYMATGGDGYTVLLAGTNVADLPVLQRDAVIEFARAEGKAGRPIAPRVEGRIVQTR